MISRRRLLGGLCVLPFAVRAFAQEESWRPGPPPPVAPYSDDPLPAEKVIVPLIFPVLGSTDWRDSYNDERGGFKHTGIDIRAPKMRPIVAPISGRLGFKQFSFWIIGDGPWEGWRILGTHLNDDTPGTNDGTRDFDFMFAPNLRRGDTVMQGQLIGYVGNSGDATGPHLHFELYGPDGIRNPYYSLKAATRRAEPRPVIEHPDEKPALGETRLDICPRAYRSASRTLVGMLVARQTLNGQVFVCASPRRYSVVLSPEAEQGLGGLSGVEALLRDRAVRLYGVEGLNSTLNARRASASDAK